MLTRLCIENKGSAFGLKVFWECFQLISTFDFVKIQHMNYKFKLLILLIISSLNITFVLAQHQNSFVGIRFGNAYPLGQFASKEFETGAYALNGRSFGGEAAWFINPRVGFGIDVSVNSIGYDAMSYAIDLKDHTPEYLSPVEMLSGHYNIATYMGGAYYKLNILPKLNSTFKLMGGILVASTPDQFFGCEIYMQGKTYWWKTSAQDSKFSFLTGVSVEYNVFEHVSVLIQGDFAYSEVAFTYLTTSGSENYTNHFKIPIIRLQPGINISF